VHRTGEQSRCGKQRVTTLQSHDTSSCCDDSGAILLS